MALQVAPVAASGRKMSGCGDRVRQLGEYNCVSGRRQSRPGYGAGHARFSLPEWGWILLTIDGLVSDDDRVRISEVFDPFDDFVPFIEAIAADEQPARWVIDEEGSCVQILFVPSIEECTFRVPAQLMLMRNYGGPWEASHDFDGARCFVNPIDTAKTLYGAFRAMADDPARDRLHWEEMGWYDEDDGAKPTWSLSDFRSGRLDAALPTKK